MSTLSDTALDLAEAGHTNEEIAEALNTTKATVSTSINRAATRSGRRQVRLFLTNRTYDALYKEADKHGIEVAGVIRTLISKHLREQRR